MLMFKLAEAKEIAAGMEQISGLGSSMEEVDEVLILGEFKTAVSNIIALEERIEKVREVGFGQVSPTP